MEISNHKTHFLGIDGGGSTCRARLCNATGQVLAEATSGPANLRLGVERVEEQVLLCTRAALRQANLADFPLKQLQVGMGLAGAVLDEDLNRTSRLREHFAHCQIHNDAYIACLGAHGGKDGAIVIVGTGSCAQVISPECSRTYGGWGFDISDQASGAWLGRLALRDCVLTLDGMRDTSELSEAIASQFSHQAAQVLRWSQSARPADYAKLAPLVFIAAEQGDTHANALVRRGCEQLILLIRAVQKHNTGRLALLGGLAEPYQRHLNPELKALISPAQGDALDGALITAGLNKTTVENP